MTRVRAARGPRPGGELVEESWEEQRRREDAVNPGAAFVLDAREFPLVRASQRRARLSRPPRPARTTRLAAARQPRRSRPDRPLDPRNTLCISSAILSSLLSRGAGHCFAAIFQLGVFRMSVTKLCLRVVRAQVREVPVVAPLDQHALAALLPHNARRALGSQ